MLHTTSEPAGDTRDRIAAMKLAVQMQGVIGSEFAERPRVGLSFTMSRSTIGVEMDTVDDIGPIIELVPGGQLGVGEDKSGD